MQIYISLPIRARSEKTFEEKYNAAKKRVEKIKKNYSGFLSKYDKVISTFEINPLGECTESEAMGRCIQYILESDAILLDFDWEKSSGCRIEKYVAQEEGITIFSIVDFN